MSNTLSLACRFCVSGMLFTVQVSASDLLVSRTESGTELSLPGGQPFHRTIRDVTDTRTVQVPKSSVLLILWNEQISPGKVVPYYAFSFDSEKVSRARRTSYDILLHRGEFDPLEVAPDVVESLRAEASGALFIVQFVTQPLEELRAPIRELGGLIRGFLPNNALVVEMTGSVRSQVAALPYVRWVGPFHPAYRLERYLYDNLDRLHELFPVQRYDIQVFQRGLEQKSVVARRIEDLGGTIDMMRTTGFRLQATLTPEQLLTVLHWDEVATAGLSGPPGEDMDKVRQIGGWVYFVEGIAGYTGEGVVGEVMDNYLATEHEAFRGSCVGGLNPDDPCSTTDQCDGGTCEGAPILHGSQADVRDHGTLVFGTVFGDGTGSPIEGAKGIIPDAQGVFADNLEVDNRMQHTCELVHPNCCPVWPDEDPYCPYNAVFQTNSVGGEQTTEYSALSVEMDDILFTFDILVCQSQSNCGYPLNSNCPYACKYPEPKPRCSRPEAWAKNIVSVGGVRHHDDLIADNDRWQGPDPTDSRASIGPACDGRVKPDLTHFYDSILTTDRRYSENWGYYSPAFGGTSAATPITCGHFGLFFQMWHDSVFSVCDGMSCEPSGGGQTVFESRPHMTTAKAMVINTAVPYCFNDPQQCSESDLTRDKQGWGMISIGGLYLLRDKFPIIINESETELLDLDPGTPEPEYREYFVSIPEGAYSLKATLVYPDPSGPTCPPASRNAINDLDLKVTSPSGTVEYWGNCGLRDGNWSSSACDGPNPPDPTDPEKPVVDTVENVFVKQADLVAEGPGTWRIEVFAAEIEEDGHVHYVNDDPSLCVENPLTCMLPPYLDPKDADFALVVSVNLDCNANGLSDVADILIGSSGDCNDNGTPDECDLADGTSQDTNGNQVPDECDVRLFVDMDAPPGGNGLSWQNAYSDLQDALDYASNPFNNVFEIWVAQGEYNPDRGSEDRSARFQLVNNVTIYGGFPQGGGDGAFSARDFSEYITVLSGDLRGDDVGDLDDPSRAENAFHVVTGRDTDTTAVLDGFIISGGNADLDPTENTGGGLLNVFGTPRVRHCTFRRNAARFGAAVSNVGAGGNLTDCLLYGNRAENDGGAVFNLASDPVLGNCTIYGNSAGGYGGGVFNSYGSDPAFAQTIFWGNQDSAGMGESSQIYNDDSTGVNNPIVIYSCVQGLAAYAGSGNIGDAPQFLDADGEDNMPGTEDDVLSVSPGSPCINAGAPHFEIGPDAVDLYGHARVINGRVDMGAYEFNIIFVDAAASGDSTGISWSDAYNYLQHGLTGGKGVEVWVAASLEPYKPDEGIGQVPGDRASTFFLPKGVSVFGGFASGETNCDQRNWLDNETVLSGDLNRDDVEDLADLLSCYSGAGTPYDLGCQMFDYDLDGDVDSADGNMTDNSHHVVTTNAWSESVVLDGFVITAGSAYGSLPGETKRGGGLYNSGGSPVLANCTFRANHALVAGGMYHSDDTSPRIINSVFDSNAAHYDGGAGMFVDVAAPVLTGCTFVRNVAGLDGGALFLGTGTPVLTRCAFLGNTAGEWGGGVYSVANGPHLASCLFSGNTAKVDGGGLFDFASEPILGNCTFSENAALLGDGGGILLAFGSPVLNNCVLWGNTDSGTDVEAAQVFVEMCTPIVNHCCIEGLSGALGGAENIGENPEFVDATGEDDVSGTGDDDLRLYASSPCIDKADNDAVTTDTDLMGNDRQVDANGDGLPTVDMGSYEFQCAVVAMPEPETVVVPDSGFGTRNRYLSFTVDDASLQEIRVTMTSLAPPFDVHNGERMWVGGPGQVCESSGEAGPCSDEPEFWAAPLECNADFSADWTQYDAVHVYHELVVPDSVYELQAIAIHESCSWTDEGNFSAPRQIRMSKYGDAVWMYDDDNCRTTEAGYVDCWTAPNGVVDFADISAAVDKFMNAPGAPQKSRSDVCPCSVNQTVDFADIPCVVDGFRGLPFHCDPPSDPCP